MTRSDNVLNMQITIVNSMKKEWKMEYEKLSDLLEQYDLLAYIDDNYEGFNSMGMKGILLDLREYMSEMGEIA